MPEQQASAGHGGGERTSHASHALYTRPMPGGGCVWVELLVSDAAHVAADRLRGRVVMERRSTARHVPAEEPVVVEEVEGDDEGVIVAELFRIARDNAAIARRILRRQLPVRAD